jgi:hypothetical protein
MMNFIQAWIQDNFLRNITKNYQINNENDELIEYNLNLSNDLQKS